MGFSLWRLLLISLGHLITDVNQGGLPSLLPVLKQTYNLTYSQVGTILLVLNLTSSVIQPFFGYWTDKTRQRWPLPLGPALAAVGLALAGQASTYGGVLAATAVCGLGVALFHPEGARAARVVAGSRRATGMAIFSVGGNIGYSLGPVVALGLVGWFGLGGLRGVLVPTLLVAAGLLAALPALARHERAMEDRRNGTAAAVPPAATNWRAEALLVLIVGIRSWIQFGVISLLPFYYLERTGGRGFSTGTLLFIFLASGALGTLVGGPLADRVGTRPVLLGSMAALLPLEWLLLHTQGWLMLVILAATGFAVVSTFTITLVMSQEFMPRYVGVASGLNTGFSIGMGGLGAAALGVLADRWGVQATLQALLVLPALGLVLSLLVPAPGRAGPSGEAGSPGPTARPGAPGPARPGRGAVASHT
ncbi:MFS transporter [Caldinitratiruptor microaerophilus]|uniref:MFS transporter n=1 Tax=Caldinitratiruptor microaerophilus TaxID=671077 RepID=A0AA35CQ86_9FIRM|nr:MFS transporter [Caldinitratiruptor microaerophilus]BDG62172.1 MFS transporter [Caldinitratiruptor microaerophilus]